MFLTFDLEKKDAFFNPSVRASTSRASYSCSSSTPQLREECSPHCEWGSLALNTYFEVELRPEQSCEVFLVEGVPAASMVYNRTDENGAPLIEAFHLNKALLLLFDAASHTRRLLCGRYESLVMQRIATNFFCLRDRSRSDRTKRRTIQT